MKLEKDNKTKGYMPKWSKEVYTVTVIKDNDFMVNDSEKNCL